MGTRTGWVKLCLGQGTARLVLAGRVLYSQINREDSRGPDLRQGTSVSMGQGGVQNKGEPRRGMGEGEYAFAS